MQAKLQKVLGKALILVLKKVKLFVPQDFIFQIYRQRQNKYSFELPLTLYLL